jgi:uncharacterized protein YdeI (YjbR/CyaY-like superfamily)
MARKIAEYPVLHVDDRSAWADWLRPKHAEEPGVWLRMAKKGSALRSPTQDEALEVALCYGWIDGQARSSDDESWLQKFTPRGKRSVWSKRNCEKVERLIAEGLMQPAGLAAIEAAKADGRWDRAYDSPASAQVPPDLQAALEANPVALAFFETLKGQNRFAILHRVQTAVRPETRARRIGKFVEMLERQEKIYP